jgi:hypothetical protein
MVCSDGMRACVTALLCLEAEERQSACTKVETLLYLGLAYRSQDGGRQGGTCYQTDQGGWSCGPKQASGCGGSGPLRGRGDIAGRVGCCSCRAPLAEFIDEVGRSLLNGSNRGLLAKYWSFLHLTPSTCMRKVQVAQLH